MYVNKLSKILTYLLGSQQSLQINYIKFLMKLNLYMKFIICNAIKLNDSHI